MEVVMINKLIVAGLPLAYTSFRGDFARIGLEVIYDIFDEVWDDTPFKTGDLVGRLPSIGNRTYKQQLELIRGALQYLEAEGRQTGEPQVTRVSPYVWKLVFERG